MNKPVLIFSIAFLSLLLISLAGIVSAHFNTPQSNSASNGISETSGMHSGMMGMNGMMGMMNGGNMGGCMSMDLDEMDKDNDGICDYCGMPVAECEEMGEMHSGGMAEMHNAMHSNSGSVSAEEMIAMHNEMHNDSDSDTDDEMSCGMHSGEMNSGMHSGMGMGNMMGMNGMH